MKNYILILVLLIFGLPVNSLKAQGSLKVPNDPLRSAAVSLYPNPTNGKFNISLKNYVPKMEVTIYNVLGQKTYESSTLAPFPINEIDFSSHPKGVYFIKISDGENCYTERIVIR